MRISSEDKFAGIILAKKVSLYYMDVAHCPLDTADDGVMSLTEMWNPNNKPKQ